MKIKTIKKIGIISALIATTCVVLIHKNNKSYENLGQEVSYLMNECIKMSQKKNEPYTIETKYKNTHTGNRVIMKITPFDGKEEQF